MFVQMPTSCLCQQGITPGRRRPRQDGCLAVHEAARLPGCSAAPRVKAGPPTCGLGQATPRHPGQSPCLPTRQVLVGAAPDRLDPGPWGRYPLWPYDKEPIRYSGTITCRVMRAMMRTALMDYYRASVLIALSPTQQRRIEVIQN
ncbi:hypothetical protein GWK47_036012 [Chionoecetes opilio]|uniref:Uncharacterized protein n=1 Tax=Chionoecetes opilio TaxID=41210 RepID=A0A8J4YEM3_CHIOP|nr:hypothetical protein GWK47_036012 [Chionoecetes opilio]